MIAAMSPVLGAIADASGRRKPWIAAFGALLVIGSCLMWFGKPGDVSVIPPLLLAYGLATIGVEFATVFNNAMMPTLVPPDQIGRLSGKTPGERSAARGIGGLAANALRIAEAEIACRVPARQHDLHRWAGVAVRVRWHLRRRHLQLEHHSDRELRYHPGHRRHVRRLARRQARRQTRTETRDHGQHADPAVVDRCDPAGGQGFDFLRQGCTAGAGWRAVFRRRGARLSRAWMPDWRRRRPAAGGVAHASDTVGAARPHRAMFRAVRADWKGHLLRRAAADRRDHRNHRKPEGGHGGAGVVLRGGPGPSGPG